MTSPITPFWTDWTDRYYLIILVILDKKDLANDEEFLSPKKVSQKPQFRTIYVIIARVEGLSMQIFNAYNIQYPLRSKITFQILQESKGAQHLSLSNTVVIIRKVLSRRSFTVVFGFHFFSSCGPRISLEYFRR